MGPIPKLRIKCSVVNTAPDANVINTFAAVIFANADLTVGATGVFSYRRKLQP
jgi:hypothetical protein